MKLINRLLRTAPAIFAISMSISAAAFDLDEIKERGVLRHLGINYANFVTTDGRGFDVDLVKGFATHIGVRYELVLSDFVHVIQDLLGRQVVRNGDSTALEGSFQVRGDMIATGFTILPWRSQVLLYSKPTFPTQVLLVARSDSAHRPIKHKAGLQAEIAETHKLLGQHSLLVMERTCLDPANYGLKGKGVVIRNYTASSNLDEMVPALLSGAADFTLLDVPDAVIDLQRWAGRIKVIGPISEHQELAAAFPKSSPKLREAFDDYLRNIRNDGTYDEMVNRHYPGIRLYFPEFFSRKF